MSSIPDFIPLDRLEPTSWHQLTEWRLREDVEINGYVTPKYFICDGGSIPFGLRSAFNPTGKGMRAFIAHDHKIKFNTMPRKQADEEFLRDLITCGVNERRAKSMYYAVRTYAVLTGKK
jgi:hypothetical protein